MPNNEFLEFSERIVKDFLHTAVILDDRAFFDFDREHNETPTTLINPDPEESNECIGNNAQPIDETHLLDASTIIRTFTEKGIICSILKPQNPDEYTQHNESYLRLMRKADIVILDWDIFNDGGDRVIELIQNNFLNLSASNNLLKEFRLIIIFSANSLDDIRRKLIDCGVNFANNDYYSSPDSSQFTHITLFNKSRTNSPVEPNRVVNFQELVDTCIKEFTRVYSGIIPNATMASITVLREKFHHILQTLNKDLDYAYLSHRTLLHTPDESERHLEEIIAKEISSIIINSHVGSKNASIDILKTIPYLKKKKYQGQDFIKCLESGTEKILKINKSTLDANTKTKKTKFNKHILDCYTHEWLRGDKDLATKSENMYAIVSSVNTNYFPTEKQLTAGVIIEDETKLLLCIQPKCDCVRLNGDVDFLFIQLKVNNNRDGTNIILENNSSFIKYKIDQRTKEIIKFRANRQTKMVVSNNQIFKSVSNINFKFVAALTNEQTLRITREFSNFISRIGLNESEFLRRNRKGSN